MRSAVLKLSRIALTTTLFVHSIYYKDFETIRLGTCIKNINSFRKKYCILDFKIIRSRSAYLSEVRLTTMKFHE